jgi:hypothetical protein
MPKTVAGVTDYDRLRSHTNHPGVLARGGYSNAKTAALGDPCDRLRERGLLSTVSVSMAAWQAVAVGNIDGDPDLEIWSMDHNGYLTRLAED